MNRITRIVIGLLVANVIIIIVLFCTQAPIRIDPPAPEQRGKTLSELQNNVPTKVEIWSKAAIGQYLWEDIVQGSTDRKNDFYLEGSFVNDSIEILFRSGASLKIESLKAFTNIQNLVLILNWRTKELVNSTMPWLQTALAKPEVKNLGIVALGNEQCYNGWFDHWIRSAENGDKFRFLFIVYDWSMIDNNRYYQWPLGVATYRNFESPNNKTSLIHDERPFLCNYIGTVYPGTSRQELLEVFTQPNEETLMKGSCIVRTRSKWIGEESDESMQFYRNALKNSELTLNPIGMNHECYRLYEAASFGSVPVIEINLKHLKTSSCDRNNVFRLFHETNAPFIYVHNWTLEIDNVLRKQHSMTRHEKVQQRKELIEWHDRFKIFFRNRFIHVLRNKFHHY